ncbi:MAG: HPr family phosphocarrier protein [Treponema sp.]|jgi:phosphocarrier protein|nr:HPr family phosphocarrier protein [Treponema sp.]
MQELKYVINDALGLHARPAGLLAKLAAKHKSDIQIGTPVKMVNAKRIIGVMALTIKQGQEMIMTFSGEDETEAAVAVKAFLEQNL